MASLFMYVVDRDFGFAPNPFHGFCTLATCKPKLRKSARVGDWVVGMGGSRLNAAGRCVFAMRVGRKVTFCEYWNSTEFRDKRPVRNGSRRMVVGDNIYHRDPASGQWLQEDSHHSLADGRINWHNLENDTQTDAVLVSDMFFYFGESAPHVPLELLNALGYKNGRGHRRFVTPGKGDPFIEWLGASFADVKNTVRADPFNFAQSDARYSAETNKISF